MNTELKTREEIFTALGQGKVVQYSNKDGGPSWSDVNSKITADLISFPIYGVLAFRWRVKPEPKQDKFYGLDGWERLKTDMDDAIEEVVESCGGVDEVEWPVQLLVFRPMDVQRLACYVAKRALDDVLEYLDEEHSDPDGDATEPTSAMKAAADAFAKVVTDEYVSWSCEPTGEVVEYTREMREKEMGQ